MLTELAWHAVGCSSWNGYRCSEWWRYSSLRAGPVSCVHPRVDPEWALGPLWRVNVADDARSCPNGLHRILYSITCLGVLLFDPGAGPCWVAWWAWQGAHLVAHFSLGGERHMRLGPAN